MKFHSNDKLWRPHVMRLAHAAEDYAHQWFGGEARASRRRSAIRNAIASLVETERMRLASMIGHRGDR